MEIVHYILIVDMLNKNLSRSMLDCFLERHVKITFTGSEEKVTGKSEGYFSCVYQQM